MKRLLVVFSVVAIAACSSDGKSKSVSNGSSAAAECKRDSDCVVVETACCDHCNGGKVLAFPKATADSHKPTCEATVCTEMACGSATASCEAGACKATIGKLGSP